LMDSRRLEPTMTAIFGKDAGGVILLSLRRVLHHPMSPFQDCSFDDLRLGTSCGSPASGPFELPPSH
jgi:hypothetical protein